MKLLIWLSKKFQSINRKQIPALVSALVLVIIIIAVSCRIHQSNQSANAENPAWNPFQLFANKETEFIPLYVKSKPEDVAPVQIAEISKKFCETTRNTTEPAQAINYDWRLNFNSALGEHTAVINVSDTKVSAKIAGRQAFFSDGQIPPQELLNEICTANNAGAATIVINLNPMLQLAEKWLKNIAPDCSFELSKDGGFTCNIQTIEPILAIKELNDIKSTMIRHWSRQPYLLMRRLAVTSILAQALDAELAGDELNAFCAVLSFSENIELPLTFDNLNWRQVVCNKDNPQRLAAAQIGLTKALSEIEFMRQLFERTSKLGVLTVNVPRDKAPTRDLWVSLQPKEDVSLSLVSGASSRDKDDAEANSAWKACWHPIYGDDENNLNIARHIDLIGEAAQVSCDETSSNVTLGKHSSPAKYLAESITSETEFVITNGKSKILRLPAGTYVYLIRGHSDNFGWDPIPEGSTEGEVSWANRHPSASIRAW
jgi:hypothetical protein